MQDPRIWLLGLCLGGPLHHMLPSLPLTAAAAVTLAFPLRVPKPAGYDSPGHGRSAQCPRVSQRVCGQVFPPEEMEQVSNKDDMKTSLKKVVKEVGVKGQRGELSSPVGQAEGV